MGDLTKNFSYWEFKCKCGCGDSVKPDFVVWCQKVRDRACELAGRDVPMPVNSGLRCEKYDSSIGGAGVHPTGEASDFGVARQDAFYVTKAAMELGATGFGFKQKGRGRFLHIDRLTKAPRPNIWSY